MYPIIYKVNPDGSKEKWTYKRKFNTELEAQGWIEAQSKYLNDTNQYVIIMDESNQRQVWFGERNDYLC